MGAIHRLTGISAVAAALSALIAPIALGQTTGRFVADSQHGCKFFRATHSTNSLESATWQGQCRQGVAQGSGAFEVRGTFAGKKETFSGEGTFAEGKLEGRAYWTSSTGYRWEAEMHDGLLNGHVFYRDSVESVTDRNYKDGKEGHAIEYFVFAGMFQDCDAAYALP